MLYRHQALLKKIRWLWTIALIAWPMAAWADDVTDPGPGGRLFVEAAHRDNQMAMAQLLDRNWQQWQELDSFRRVGDMLAASQDGSVRVSLDTFSGELHGTLQSYAASTALTLQRYLLGQRYSERRRSALYSGLTRYPHTMSEPLPDWRGSSVWGSLYRDWSLVQADGNAGKLRATGPGATLGFDRGNSDNFWGLALQGLRTEDVTIAEHEDRTLPTDEGGLETVAIYAYGGLRRGDWEFDGSLGYLRHDMETERQLYYNAPLRQASGRYQAEQFNLTLGAGKPVYGEVFVVQPHLGLSYSHFSRDAFTETGAGELNLILSAEDFSVLEGRASLNITMMRHSARVSVTPEFNLGVSYALLEEAAGYRAALEASPHDWFDAKGLARGSVRTDIAMGLIGYLSERTQGRFEYQGRFTSREESHSLFITARWLW